jgi:hypothetical protein
MLAKLFIATGGGDYAKRNEQGGGKYEFTHLLLL